MPRLKAVNAEEAQGRARELLEGVAKKLGSAPNVMKTMANSPAVLEAYLGFSTALGKGTLSAKLREQIALVVAETNNCEYCLSAHTALGKMAGLTADEIAESRQGHSRDTRTEAILAFVRRVVSQRGWITDSEFTRLRDVGVSDAEVSEIVANVAINLFTNYLNHIAQTEVDFPRAQPLGAEAACPA